MKGEMKQRTNKRNRITKSVIQIEGKRVLLSIYGNEDGSKCFCVYNPNTSTEYEEDISLKRFLELSKQCQSQENPKALYVKVAQLLRIGEKVLGSRPSPPVPLPSPPLVESSETHPVTQTAPPLPPTPKDINDKQGTIKPKAFRGGCKFQGKHYVVTVKILESASLKVTVYNPRTSQQQQKSFPADFFQLQSTSVDQQLEFSNDQVKSMVEAVLCEEEDFSGKEEISIFSRPSLSRKASSDTIVLNSEEPRLKPIGGISSEMAGLDIKVPSDEENDFPEDSEIEAEEKSDVQLLEEALNLKDAGNTAFSSGLFEEALGLYSKAKELAPAQLVFRLNCSAALLELGRHAECVSECKHIISVVRSLQRKIRSSSNQSERSQLENMVLGSMSAEVVVSKAYARIGSSFYKRGRWQRALNAYIMCTKETSADADFVVKKRLDTCLKKLRQFSLQGADTSVPDIEDMLSKHSVLAPQDNFKFQCTMCGECCRTSDYIFLSPYDIFHMTRSPNMVVHNGVNSTIRLRSNPDFKEALKYTLKDGLPVCFLRPIQSKSGQCHFAYPLHVKNEQLMSYGETKKHGLEAYRPVDPSEYNLTEEEEQEALRSLEHQDSASDTDLTSNNSLSSDEEQELPPEYEGPTDGSPADPSSFPEPVLNSYGRQALGCTFGASHMPTMCASYPLANEISWVDFWHSRKSQPGQFQPFWIRGAPSAALSNSTESDSWIGQEKVMVVNTPACEGFFSDDQKKTSPCGNGEPVVKPLKTQTIQEFMTGESNLEERLKHQQWFMTLFEEINQRNSLRLTSNERIKRCFVEQIARIWYDFDALITARSRPFKSYNRLQRSIDTLTWTVVNETERFLDMQKAIQKSPDDEVRDYETLLKRLNI